MAFHFSTAGQHFQGAANGAAGVSAGALAERRAEHDHDAVTDELVEKAAIFLDDFVHGGEVAVEPSQDLLRGHAGKSWR